MRVASGLESHEEECQANDGEEATDVVDLLENRLVGEAVGSGVIVRVVENEETNSSNAVIDQRDPGDPAPSSPRA